MCEEKIGRFSRQGSRWRNNVFNFTQIFQQKWKKKKKRGEIVIGFLKFCRKRFVSGVHPTLTEKKEKKKKIRKKVKAKREREKKFQREREKNYLHIT